MTEQTRKTEERDRERPPRRVCAVHDLSCFGRCALTVIMPVLCAMGEQVIPLPTALLSTHTGGFDDFHFLDLSDSMEKITDHFERLNLKFDAIYPGFLGDRRQIDTVSRLIDRFGNDALVMVDPVMGDDGLLYSTYTQELVEGVKLLCRKADIITPNLTEACFLTGSEYRDTSTHCRNEALEQARGLARTMHGQFGCRRVVITGIPYGEKYFATYGCDAETGSDFFYSAERICVDYPGTGDLFASVFLGKLLRGDDFENSAVYASDFVRRVMLFSSRFPTPVRDGVAFEAFLGELATEREKMQ